MLFLINGLKYKTVNFTYLTISRYQEKNSLDVIRLNKLTQQKPKIPKLTSQI